MLHQNNTCPIMAGGCHVVMTENVVIKGDDIKRQCWTTSLFLGGDVHNYFRPFSSFVSPVPGGFDSFTTSMPARSADARDRKVATQNNQVARLSWKLEGGSRAPEAGSHIPRMGRRNSDPRLSKLDENTSVRARLRV